MSWGEVSKINNNMKRSINEQLRDMKYNPIRVITSNTTYTPEKTGLYKVICVGAGGDGGYGRYSNDYGGSSGGGGGVAIKTMTLSSSESYSVTVGTTASFAYTGGAITAISGGNASGSTGGTGGTASGGDYNFPGEKGGHIFGDYATPRSASVGVIITDLTQSRPNDTHLVKDTMVTFTYGKGILDYGVGGTGAEYYTASSIKYVTTKGSPAAVLIIPLEMEE